MNLLFTNSHPSDLLANERAGHLVRARELITALRRAGHRVTVIEAANGQVSQAAATAYRGRLGWLPRRVQLISRDIARLVQSAAHGWRVGREARSSEYDAILETHNTGSIAGWLASKRSSTPLIIDDVTPAAEDSQYYELGLPRLAAAVRRLALRRAHLLVTVSSSIETALFEEGFTNDKVCVVPNGTIERAGSDDRAHWRTRLSLADHQQAVIYVGSFQPFHSAHLFVEAMAEATTPDTAYAVFVGDGETKSACEALAQRLGVGHRCVFVGRLDHRDISGVLAAADAAILPGTAEYMNPMKLYEYVAAGLPIVAPDQRAVRETLNNLHGVTLFRQGDAASCAAALAEALSPGAERPDTISDGSWDDRAASLTALFRQPAYQSATR